MENATQKGTGTVKARPSELEGKQREKTIFVSLLSVPFLFASWVVWAEIDRLGRVDDHCQMLFGVEQNEASLAIFKWAEFRSRCLMCLFGSCKK